MSPLSPSTALRILAGEGYTDVCHLGSGKDGIVWSASRDGRRVVVKVLSDYARRFLPITRAIAEAKVQSPHFYQIQISGDRIIEYPDEQLVEFDTAPAQWLPALGAICDLEASLSETGFVLWDLGSTHMNYGKTPDGVLRWIDYGGNSFLFLRAQDAVLSPPRANLVIARHDFVRAQILLHLCVFGLGHTNVRSEASHIQDDPAATNSASNVATQYLRGTLYEPLANGILQADVLTPGGWRELRALVDNSIATQAPHPVLEHADVSRVTYLTTRVEVRGYQNFDLSAAEIRAYDQGHSWAPSSRKLELFDRALSQSNAQTLLDVGCNLGLFVFAARIRHGLTSSGIDYNPEYVEYCREIDHHLRIGCHFSVGVLEDVQRSYDCVSLLGIIHHLLHRTEQFLSLDAIVDKLANVAKQSVIVEFPTENDAKARKWTRMPGRARPGRYDLATFLNAASRRFSKIENLGDVSSCRPVFVLQKEI